MKNFLKFPLFRFLSEHEKSDLTNNSSTVRYKKGEIVFKKGTLNNAAGILISGFVKLYAEEQNKKRIIDISKPGWLIAILSVFNAKTYNITASAVTDCEIRIINKSILDKLIRNNGLFAEKIIYLQSQIANRYISFLAFQNQKNVRGRIAEIILYLSVSVYQAEEFPQTVTRKEMAEFANTTTETVIRIISELKSEKIISLSKNRIKIIKKDLLHRYVRSG